MLEKKPKKAAKNSIEACDTIYDLATQSIKPISMNIINSWAQDLIKASLDPETLTIEDWLCKKLITRSTFWRLKEKHPVLKEAHEFALQAIGNRRWTGCAKFDLHPAAVMPTMSHYNPDYIKDEERRAKLKAMIANQEQQQRQVVVMEVFPESDQVPKLLED
jgi:hypothetical protein